MKISLIFGENSTKCMQNIAKNARYWRYLSILNLLLRIPKTPKRNAVGSTPITDAKHPYAWVFFFSVMVEHCLWQSACGTQRRRRSARD